MPGDAPCRLGRRGQMGKDMRVIYVAEAYDRGIDQVEGTYYEVSPETAGRLEAAGCMVEIWLGCPLEIDWETLPREMFGEEVVVTSRMGSRKSTLGAERRDFGPFDEEE